MTDNEITYQIRGAVFNVYNAFGPGLLESVYEEALVYELEQHGLKVERQTSLTQISQISQIPLIPLLLLLSGCRNIIKISVTNCLNSVRNL